MQYSRSGVVVDNSVRPLGQAILQPAISRDIRDPVVHRSQINISNVIVPSVILKTYLPTILIWTLDVDHARITCDRMVHIEKHVEDYDRAIEFHGALDNQARSIVGLVGPLCDIVDSRPTIFKASSHGRGYITKGKLVSILKCSWTLLAL